MYSYSKPKGTKGISSPKGGSNPKQSKKAESANANYRGIVDSRPSNSDRKQSAK